jgi:hypothetical protein
MSRHPLDRSVMFTNLLTLSAKFGALERKVGERLVTEALLAWYDAPSEHDMFAWTKRWIKENHPELLPFLR